MDARIKAVTFDEEKHKYFYDGKELFGVTSVIGKMLGKSFPDNDTVKIATMYGSDVHKDIENYFNNHFYWFNSSELSTNASKWIEQRLKEFTDSLVLQNIKANMIECEVMVSDFLGTASKVDIVVRTDKGAYLFDIKTTSHFDREYCSLQLSTYKKLYEYNYHEKVLGMYVIGTKFQRAYKILEQPEGKILKILKENEIKAGALCK